ncbi:hypothetical protein WMF04_01155 [Sorangium sp. So ce260]|uniref:hypothetical protein n=1 Tax=Sorangium sp. So ce260 TaxID=3133291 RepID=UPI003F63EFBC
MKAPVTISRTGKHRFSVLSSTGAGYLWMLALAISLLVAGARAESFDAVTSTPLPNGARWSIV